jgi:uncharacterized protein
MMEIRSWISLRMFVLVLLWTIPMLVYVTIGMVAIYQNGWLPMVALSLPFVWLIAWLVGKFWKPAKLSQATRGPLLHAPEFWTPRDAAAIAIVEKYRAEAVDVDRVSIADPARYQQDAVALAEKLSEHYHGGQRKHAFEPLTMIEIFAVIHLAAEDLEDWMLQNLPGCDLATVGHLSRLPELATAFDGLQKVIYFASTLFNPIKLLTYPIWRKSGRVTIEIQNELIRGLYQRYLGLVGYYLIEMYSGRLRGGAKQYRERFGAIAMAVHAAGGQLEQLSAVNDVATTIAVMGQVKAGKSSVINALIGDSVAATDILPLTRQVKRYEYPVPGSANVVTLLDTPGYDEADVTKKQLREIATASEAADIVLLVMAANVSARQADLEMVKQLDQHYRDRSHLKPPLIIAVLTHIDLLRPIREWSPPYYWQNPIELKEQSIAGAVNYVRELFGDRISGYACVYTGTANLPDTSVADELVPQIMQHLSQGKMVAVLKAFYKRLGSRRLQRLLKQSVGLLKSL